MALLLVVLFIALPIAELYVIIQVGGAIGVLPTLALLIADSFLGVALLRSQGRQAWARFNQALAESRVPAREVFDGAMLLTPGFITDVFGLVLLIPPGRAIARRFAVGLAGRRIALGWTIVGNARMPGRDRGAQRSPGAAPRRHPSRRYDYEGTATEVRDEGELPGPPATGER
jgi:UPF0716 protein FxsA